MKLQIDRQAFHETMCRALGIEPGHGSKKAVADVLDVADTQYGAVLRGKGSLDTLALWASKAGVHMLVMNYRVVFTIPPLPAGEG